MTRALTLSTEQDVADLAYATAEWAVGPYGTEAGADPFALYAECYGFLLRYIDDAEDLVLWQRKDYRDILTLARRVL